MKNPAEATDLERRKKVRIRLRGDLAIAPQKYEGRTYYVVKDPVSLRYYRFKEQEHYLIQLMDGSYTLDEAQKAFETRFRPERLTLEDLEGFAQQLLSAGLAQNESPQAGKQLFDRRKKRKRSEWMQTLTNILYIKIPVYDPDKLLTGMLRYLSWIFTTWFMLVSVAVMLAAGALVATHFETFRDKLPSYHEFFSFKTVAYLWLALGVVKVIHEFGHGLSCKAFGGEVHEMGALFLCFSPCLYCNVSDAWTLPSKWKRIIISFAGIYVELIIAAISTFIWWNSAAHPFINNLSLSLMIVCSVSTVVFNANPLMRYDGYYILADWLEIPNLRDRSNRYLKNLVSEYCLGIEVQPEAYMALWRRIMFVTYAFVSYIYRWVVTFSILVFMARFLKPYKLEVISQMLAIAAASSMVGWPIYRLGKNLHRRGRLPDMKPLRVSLTISAIAALLLFVFLVPLPVSWIRSTALVRIRPEYTTQVFVVEQGSILEQLLVKDGDLVVKDQDLAYFSNLELDMQLNDAQAQYTINERDRRHLEKQRPDITDADELNKLEGRIRDATYQRDKAYGTIRVLEQRKERLVLRAPRDGIIMSPPKVDDVGKLWDEHAMGQAFCSVGDPTKLRAMLPIPPVDYHLLTENLERVEHEGQELPVTIRVTGRDDHTWQGKLLTPLPQMEAAEVPQQLTTRGGGPLAIKPGQTQGRFVPQKQQYLIFADFVDPDAAICPGALAQVKIHCRPRTCAWWVWRTISDAFDPGLL
jgi:putative peptide zinc metalloprotease protein